MKHYFLLDQGDFIVQFMDLCGDELCQSVDMVETTRLESLLELALRTSAAKEDPYKDNVRVELLPYDLIYQVTNFSFLIYLNLEFRELPKRRFTQTYCFRQVLHLCYLHT